MFFYCCRFYRFSSMATDDDRRRDAINSIRFYYAHVFNGVRLICILIVDHVLITVLVQVCVLSYGNAEQIFLKQFW